jgi:hypothetical protein
MQNSALQFRNARRRAFSYQIATGTFSRGFLRNRFFTAELLSGLASSCSSHARFSRVALGRLFEA